jgi:septum formation protein
LDGNILGKPASATDALDMLRSLSGRTHQVFTAVAVIAHNQLNEVLQRSQVRFAEISEETLKAYCATQEPYDKAGSYGVQGLAAQFIEHISGSYTGIMGLPLFETSRLLKQAGIRML